MKGLKYFFFILTFVVISVFTSCTKDNDTDGNNCIADTGGSLTLVVYPRHHGASIWSHGNYRDTVYVKFNTQVFPGTNPLKYDLALAGDSGEDHVHVEGMKCGDYYIYATGWDTTLAPPDTIVRGGIPYSTEAAYGEIIINVPVVE